MSIALKPIIPVALFISWLSFVVSCEEPEAPPMEPEVPTDTTIIIPSDTVITPTDTVIIPSDTVVIPMNEPHAMFSFSNNNCTVICSLAFTNLSHFANTYSWDFGDGSSISMQENPNHFYEISGNYRVILTASKNGMSDSDTQMVEIKKPVSPFIFGTSLNEYGTGFVQTSDGGYVITGSKTAGDGSLDVYLFKTDASRNVVWEKAFGTNGNQAANAIKQTEDGGFILIGYSNDGGNASSNVYLIKTDGDGNLLWRNNYDYQNGEDIGQDIVVTENGYLITGSTQLGNSTSNYDLLLIKTDLQGNVEWQKNLGSNLYDAGYSVLQTFDGNFVVGGTYSEFPNYYKHYLIKLDETGTILWEQRPVSELAIINSMQQTSDGGFILGGLSDGSGGHRGAIAKADANGVIEWSNVFVEPGVLFNSIECIRITSDGGIIVCGNMDRAGYDYPPRKHVMVIKTDAAGNQQWIKDYAIGGRDGNAFDIQQTPDGGYALVGNMLIEPIHAYPGVQYPRYDRDVYFLKIDQNGNLQ